MIKNVPREEISDGNIEKLRKAQKVSTLFYPIFLSSVAETPVNVKHKWEEKMSIDIVKKNEWEQYFMIPHNVTMNAKLISFQIQISHRILCTNSRLFIFKILDTEMCSFCHETKESISYLFYGCLARTKHLDYNIAKIKELVQY